MTNLPPPQGQPVYPQPSQNFPPPQGPPSIPATPASPEQNTNPLQPSELYESAAEEQEEEVKVGFFERFSEDGVISALSESLDNVQDKLEKRIEKKEKELFQKEPGTGVLLINQHHMTVREIFSVYDEYKSVKYTVKGKLTSPKHHLRVYDASGREIGRVKEKLIALRSPLSLDSHPSNIAIEIRGKEIGLVKTTGAILKRKLEITFNNWHIEGNFMGFQYRILNGEEEIAHMSQKLSYLGDTYVVTFPDIKNELIVLMLALAIDASEISKSEEAEFRRKNRERERRRKSWF